MAQRNPFTLEEECQLIWQAALKGWNAENGNLVVPYQEFQAFLLPFYKSVQARLDRMKAMRLYGFIDWPQENLGRGIKKYVTIYSKPARMGMSQTGMVSENPFKLTGPGSLPVPPGFS